jgi:CHAT domain-containing protein/tetratricopeptide (TPR) repeat protein
MCCSLAFGLICLTSMLAEPSSRQPAIGLVEVTKRAAAEVAKELDLADRGIKAANFDEALRHAELADKIARLSLHPTDPGRTRAAMVLARVHYTVAGKARDTQAARKWAGEARRAALDANDAAAALRWAGIANALAEQTLPKEDSERARAAVLNSLAQSTASLVANDLPSARTAAKLALETAERSLPLGDADRTRALMAVAAIEFRDGHQPASEALFERAATEGEAIPGADRHPRVAALRALTQIRSIQGGDSARSTAARCLAEAAKLGDPWDPLAVSASQVVAGAVWSPMIREADKDAEGKAEARLIASIEMFRKALVAAGADRATAGSGTLFLAKYRYDLRRIADAEKTLLEIDRDGGPGESPLFAGDYWTLRGLVATDRNDYATARDCHDRAFRLYFRARLPQQVVALNNLGQLLLRQGDYETAESILRGADAFSVADQSLRGDPQRAFILTNLAKCLESANNLPEALRRHREALAIARGIKPPNPFLLCALLNNIGINRYSAGEFEEAGAQFTEARGIATGALGSSHFHVAEIDVNRGWLALAQDHPAEAEALFQSALIRFRELGDDHPRVAEVLSYLARVEARSGTKAKGAADLEEALGLQERALARTLRSPLSERDRLAFVQELRVHPESSAWPGVLDTFLELAPELGVGTDEQYRRVLAWKGVVSRHAPPRADQLEDDPEVRALAQSREARLGALRDASVARMGGRAAPSRGEMGRLEAEIEELERQLSRKSPRFARGIEGIEVTPARVVAALPPRTALLDVIEVRQFRTDDTGEVLKDFRYVAFLVRPDRPIQRVEFTERAGTVNAAILAFRADIESRRDLAGSGQALARMVRDPLLPHLDGIEMLILAGDDLLNYLPMGAIPGSKPGSYWVEEIAFGAVPSAQSLVERRGRRRDFNEGAVVVGGIDYLRWPRLDGTIKEAAEVGRIYARTHDGKAADLISGAGATAERLRAMLPKRRYAHLATHGFFQAAKGEGLFKTHGSSAEFDSGIVLAGPKSSPGDDLLTAEEIGLLDLRGTELVVLSACESGLGRLRAGQGVIGLVGALDRAGAASVVSTLWKVSDEGTVPFMAAFYRHLWTDPGAIGPARALRAAQVDMIRGTERGATGVAYSHPFYWAAFVQVGDPAPSPRS